MIDDPLRDPAAPRRWVVAGLVAVLLHGAPAMATLALVPAETVWEDVGVAMIADFAEEARGEEATDGEVEAVDADASQSTPEVKESLSAKSEDDLPETDASTRRPDDPDLLLAEKKTLERTENPAEQQTTEETAPSPTATDSAASQAQTPTAVEETAAAAPSQGSVREAPPAPPSWAKSVMAHLGRHKRYPSEARSRGEEGEVLVALTIGRDGRVTARRLHRSAGSSSLDAAALDLVDRASPLPALPATYLVDRVEVVVPIRFRFKS